MPDVVVVAPVRVLRESIAAALDAKANLNVVGEAATLDEGLGHLRELKRPAVGLVDGPLLPDLVVTVLNDEPQPKLLAVGVPEDDAVAWIEAGVSGYVPPDGSLDDVVAAVERVADDELAASPQVTAHLANRVRQLAADSRTSFDEERLTPREVEILDLLADGLTNKQIARRLSIELPTVKNHVHRIFMKLGVTRRAEAVRRIGERRQSAGR